ncbi:MAG: beta-mannanase [Thermoleophilia bacterium]|nr:beta-mannanase [Thermoleophilia bacterium]GIK78236.1 MAG: beta-mannanase [Actinomycetes bacterium]
MTRLALMASLTLLAAGGAAGAGADVLKPPAGGRIYHAANAGFGGPEDRVTVRRIHHFERAAAKRIAWAYFSDNWIGGISFPIRQARAIRAAGRTPFIRMMPRSSFRAGGPDRRYAMQSIAAGRWDRPRPGSGGLIRWCRRAAALGDPLLVEFGTEVNGSWFPWNGRWNGGGRRDGYGDPASADGPERFRDAYRHIVDVCDSEGAENITWFFHVDAAGAPGAAWNDIAAYYPGDAYVDWIGVSAYGSLRPDYGWRSFRRVYGRARAELRALGGKPIAVLETGVREDRGSPGRKARWTARMLRDARRRFPEIAAISWWNERYRDNGFAVDLRIDSSASARRAYRRGVRGRAYATRARFAPG